ncbi:hypothetical protein AM571_PC02132 (plasmid) [Rhizobium etli 8C-3]|uniref:Uncharacterized protein n=1 Tax=Rhizobium etli 8C-3 TaxID=538025 RepID=A0A1L5PI13_RHIET|nr:hypothetical protein AM571_PC02132 [Rhizobium etli 8C-3]
MVGQDCSGNCFRVKKGKQFPGVFVPSLPQDLEITPALEKSWQSGHLATANAPVSVCRRATTCVGLTTPQGDRLKSVVII